MYSDGRLSLQVLSAALLTLLLDALGDSQHFQVWVNTRGYDGYSVGGCEANYRTGKIAEFFVFISTPLALT